MAIERPKKGTLTAAQRNLLIKEYFTPWEVRQYNLSKSPDGTLQDFDFNSKTFMAARRSRQKWAEDLKKAGWKRQEINMKIMQYYNLKAGRTPFDFLKLSYRPHKVVSDFVAAVRSKIRSRVSRTFGRAYGRRIRPALRPRYVPKRPRFPTRPKSVKGKIVWPGK